MLVRASIRTPLRLPSRRASTRTLLPGLLARPRSRLVFSCGAKTCRTVSVPPVALARASPTSVANRACELPPVGTRMRRALPGWAPDCNPFSVMTTGPSKAAIKKR
jgi:hypothetical protein